MDFFFKLTFSKKIFQEYHQNIKQFGSRSGSTFVLGPNCLQSYQQTTKVATSGERVKDKYGKVSPIFMVNTVAWLIPSNVCYREPLEESQGLQMS